MWAVIVLTALVVTTGVVGLYAIKNVWKAFSRIADALDAKSAAPVAVEADDEVYVVPESKALEMVALYEAYLR